VFQNLGKTNLFMWGANLEGHDKDMPPEPRVLPPGSAYRSPVDNLLKEESQKVPKGSADKLHLDVFLKNATGKKYTANYFVIPTWKGDAMIINIQQIGIKANNW
jgi:hypothetical protein